MEDNAEGNSHVRVHLVVGKVDIEIESSEASIERVFDRVVGLIEALPDSAQSVEDTWQPDSGPSQMEPTANSGTVAASAAVPSDELDQKKHKTPPTKKAERLHAVDLGLSPEQRDALHEFYKQKAPVGQNDHVLTVMSGLNKSLGSSPLSKDQIFTGLHTVNERAPKRLQSVLSNLMLGGLILRVGDGYVMHHTGEDHVEKDLPAKDNGTP